ncbi:hypothetical protein [Flavobacterium sp. 1355]|uniref:hypothetical protein n=1 Tax=Flavobacterium sp. 1355 TaxID=2806571 RepID=UPI001AE83F0E|nr:hypothetical protein [Flavobacterium sp. 1355]MBP1221986.1 hypothetical protein [Flavobacterium sp. 1355]
MRTKILIFFFCLAVLLGCKDKKSKQIMEKNPATKEQLLNFSYKEALEYYGEPIETSVFDNAKENEIFPGIRAGIGKYYKSGIKISIKEAIWSKNDSIRIAVWYTKKQNQWIPFDSFEYDKHSDF